MEDQPIQLECYLLRSYALFDHCLITFSELLVPLQQVLVLLQWLQGLGIRPVEFVTLTVFWTSYRLTSITGSSLDVASLTVQVLEKTINGLVKKVTGDLSKQGEGSDTRQVILPGSALSDLVGITSEPLAWLGLYLQAWAKRLQPVAKKKKKGAASSDQNEVQVSAHLLSQLESMRSASISALEQMETRLADYLSRPMEKEVGLLCSLVRQDSGNSGSPGVVISVMEGGVDIASRLAARMPDAKNPWSAAPYLRNMVGSQRAAIGGLKDLSAARLRVLKSFKF
jgi:hypothetical protein